MRSVFCFLTRWVLISAGFPILTIPRGLPSSTKQLRKPVVCRRLVCSWHTQNRSFSAICNWREDPWSPLGNRVEVICPKMPLWMLRLGFPKFT